MKKYFVKFLAFILALCVPFAILFFYVQSLPSVHNKSIGATIRYKIELVKNTAQDTPRIILVGGSSSPYGTICSEFTKEFNLPCINIGATAYLGLEYYISVINKYARKGDIVIFAPENIILRDKNIDYFTVWTSVDNDKAALKCIPLSYYPGMAFSFLEYSKTKLELKDKQELNNEYHSDFGPMGDVIKFRTTLLESGYNKEDTVILNKDVLYSGSINALNRCYTKMKQKGVYTFFTFAPLDELAITSSKEDVAEYENEIKRRLKMPVIGNMSDHTMQGKYFFDSNNHLTTEGAKINTAIMIEELKAALQKT